MQLQEAENQIITHYEVYDHRPADQRLLIPAVESMHSHLCGAEPRRIPQQPRGERRVARLLEAAAAEIAAVGYDSATMSAIARRAGAPIGSLYQFFPNKQAVTHALRTEYGKDYDTRLAATEADARWLSLDQLIARRVNRQGEPESHVANIVDQRGI